MMFQDKAVMTWKRWQERYGHELLAVLVVIASLFIRLGLLLNTADFHGVSNGKILQAVKIMDHPFNILFWTPVHPPLHIIFLIIGKSLLICPRTISLIFGVMSIAVLYLYVKEVFDKQIALYSIIGACLYSSHIIYSTIATSETSFHFFLLSGMYFYQLSGERNKQRRILLSGLAMGMASMCRYEGLLFIAFFICLLLKEKRRLLLFLVSSLSLPSLWMIVNYLGYANPFEFIQANNLTVPIQFDWIRQKGLKIDFLYKLLFWPNVLIKTLGIPVFICGLTGMICGLFKLKDKALPVAVMLFFFLFVFFTVRESLYLQERYAIILGLFWIPFSVYFFMEMLKTLKNLIPDWVVLVMLWTMLIPLGPQVLDSPLFVPSFARDIASYLEKNTASDNIMIDHCGDEKFREPIKVLSKVEPARFIPMPYRMNSEGSFEIDKDELFKAIRQFSIRHIVYSPQGDLAKALALDTQSSTQARQGFLFALKYKNDPYFIYSISEISDDI